MTTAYDSITSLFKPEYKDEIIDVIKTTQSLHGIGQDQLLRHFTNILKKANATVELETKDIMSFYSNFNKHNTKPLTENSINTIFIFGAGGTASWFLPKLLKVCNHYPKSGFNIVLVDGDVVRR